MLILLCLKWKEKKYQKKPFRFHFIYDMIKMQINLIKNKEALKQVHKEYFTERYEKEKKQD